MNLELDNLDLVTNPRFWPLYRDESRVLVLYGGAGSGKNIYVVPWALLQCN